MTALGRDIRPIANLQTRPVAKITSGSAERRDILTDVGARRRNEPPEDLSAARFKVDGEELMVLSWPASSSTIPGLSDAESDVLRAALGGLSNAEIARERGRSVFTIQNQVASALRKLGVTTRAEAAALLAKAPR